MWLIESENEGSYYWNGNIWTKDSLFNKIQAWIDSKIVSLEGINSNHPMAKRILKMLIKQFPETSSKIIDFDGYRPGTVKDFIQVFHGSKDLPKYLYHGTSVYRWENIKDNGLMPRAISGSDPVFGAGKSHAIPASENLVYLATNIGNTVKFAGRDAQKDGSKPLILKIDTKGLTPDRLYPDEDSQETNWQDSMYKSGILGYQGVIKPDFITPNTILVDNLWRPVRKEDLEPEDWLGKQFLKMKDSPTTFKWINPKSS